MKIKNNTVTVHGFAVSGIFVTYLLLGYLILQWGLLLFLLPLAKIFPTLTAWEWLTALPSFGIIFAFIVEFLTGIYTVVMTPDKITLRWWGINVRTIPVSELQLFCAVGNNREDVLCFSCLSIEEIAELQEKRLLKNLFKKYGVPFRKQHQNWQDSFTQEFLNHLRTRSFLHQTKSGVIVIRMLPELQYLLQHMYPQLPYRNLTGVHSTYASLYSPRKKNEAVCFPLQLYLYHRSIENDGIHIVSKKGEMSFIPAEQIKSIVRVDFFKAYEKYYPHHMPLLYISCSTEEELAAQFPNSAYNEIDIPQKQALLAMIAAKNKAFRWRIKDKGCCVLHYTEETIQALQQMCPHIRINTISEQWIHNTQGQL